MVSFRFPFSFSQPPRPPVSATANAASRPFSTAAILSVAVAAAAGGAGIAISQDPNTPFLQSALNFLASNRSSFGPMWGSLSLSENSSPVTESRTGVSFPAVLGDTQRLLGVGLRRKAILGLKNIDVYAFGIYADDGDIKKCLSQKYEELSASEVKGNEALKEDLVESDVSMTIRLQIVYGRLSIRSVRSAFEDSVGSRLQKFSGSDNKELLQRFTSQFKDEYKLPRGSIIDLSREHGYVLRTTIDGKEVGSIQSKLLCRSILDLYIGDEPFDRKAKEDVELNLASLLGK
ncbi:Fatty-acid-binding protein 1 [Sesamum alatum]|uniref:Fatty-acid-binding protein 1 n=1 Tax=Sesamum alatum TaxID=300844 RepID=A0AAE2CDL7_9LAMI|nr:Fatty-acid-binding protein 1 [Sesamum alatum]